MYTEKALKELRYSDSAFSLKLILCRSSYRANACACTAFDTCISVYNVLAVALAYSAYRTFCSTCAAADAIVTDFVCHNTYTSLKYFALTPNA